MTIKEIAQMSNVSISTVSKILNGKDQSISKETREKVLRIAREYHYIPYESAAGVFQFLIGVIVKDTRKGRMLLAGINRGARKQGYGVYCCEYGSEKDSEKKAVSAMCAQNVSMVIWQRNSRESMEYLPRLEEKGITVFYCDFLLEAEGELQFTLDYGRYGYEAVTYLAERQHKRIGCLVQTENEKSSRFVKGFYRCLYDLGLESRADFVMEWNSLKAFSDIALYGITALVCLEEEIAADVYRKAADSGYKIPKDLSILTITECREQRVLYPRLTGIYLPVEELGEYACSQVIAYWEKSEKPEQVTKIEVLEGDSAGEVPDHMAGKIVVVGSINMDSVISVRDFPEAGQTCIAQKLHSYAGGKGFNQAVGAAKLGADVVLVGKIGQDYEAKVLRDTMAGYGLCTDGIFESPAGGTGKAYITVAKNGESNIIVYAGANRLLTEDDLYSHKQLFRGAQYCLLQLETPAEIVDCAAGLAKEQGIKTILKPAAVDEISDSLLGKIDIFVPNRKELFHLCPEGDGIEEKAESILKRGVKEVIVTLDEHGCMWKNHELTMYFQAAEFEAVDTTGAADAFIAALAVYLSEGFSMKLAIQYATYAAGFSITRDGVQSAMADRLTMDAYADKIAETIACGTENIY